MVITIAGTVAVLISAAVNDVRHGKIPNILLIILLSIEIGSEAISRFVLKSPVHTGEELLKGLVAGVLIIIFLYPFFLLGELGAGDIKLMAVTALSVANPLIFVFMTFIIGALASIVKIIRKNKKTEKGETREKLIVHLSVPILVAYCLAVIFGRQGLA